MRKLNVLSAVTLLVAMLGGPRPSQAQTIDWGAPAMQELLDRAAGAVASRDTKTEQAWREAGMNLSPDVRAKLAIDLGPRRLPQALPILGNLVEDSEPRVRAAAISALEAFFNGGFHLVAARPGYGFVWWIHAGGVDAKLARLRTMADPAERDRITNLLDRMAFLIRTCELRCVEGKGTPHAEGGRVKVMEDAVNPNGLVLLVDGKRTRVHLYGAPSARAYSADGKYLAVGSAASWIYFPSDANGNDLKQYAEEPPPGSYQHVRGARAGWILLFSAETGQSLGQIEVGPVTHLAFSEDSKTLLYQAGERRKVVPRSSVPPLR